VTGIRASRSGRAGSGIRSAPVAQPPAASPSRASSSAAPQETSSARPSGSIAASCRSRSACSSSTPRASTQCQGWVLWIDGARTASWTARSSSARDGCSLTRSR
jgi:hypothetical protein